MKTAKKMKILLASSEIFPFAKTGGLADVSYSLTRSLASRGHDARAVMPLYKCVSEANIPLEKVAGGVKHPMTGKVFSFDIYKAGFNGLEVYFIKNDKYFNRSGLYGSVGGDYQDNPLRFSFFSKAVLASTEIIGFKPDIIHCNDWQTALVPVYLKKGLGDDPRYSGMRTLLTIHNMAYQGLFNNAFKLVIGMPDVDLGDDLEFYGKINFLKGGILHADAVNTVSQKYAEEILKPEFGCGLENVLRAREQLVFGIPNGVDYDLWSPEKDKYIAVNYSPQTLDKKAECKKDLMNYVGLEFSEERPLIGFVGRLVQQKGVDLIAGAIDRLVEMDVAFVILGEGEEAYNVMFRNIAKVYADKVRVYQELNDELAHKIEAGCDIFLMPSRFEPCGLNQMYSIKYGTPPIVRATGGLDDIIIDYDEDRDRGNGFKFVPAQEEALIGTVVRAIKRFNNKELWRRLMLQGMAYDFSWEHSAGEYEILYTRMMKGEI